MVKSGQATFEFILAAVFFFMLLIYAVTFMNTTVAQYSMESRNSELEARAAEISDYLVHINLTSDWPVLSYSRISSFHTACNNNYDRFVGFFDLLDNTAGVDAGRGNFKVMINETAPGGNVVLADCRQGTEAPEIERAEVERFAVSESNNVINVKVVTW